MSDPDTEAALREMSRWIGSSRHRCGSLVQTWQAQEASASQGRRDLHQKFEALRGEFHAVATQVAGALKDIADIKPSVQAFENAKAQAKGAQMLGKIIWGILLFAGGGIGWMLANWITITRSRRCTDQRRSLTRKASPSNALRFVAALALVCVALFSSSAEARKVKRTYHAHPDCNVTMPCEGVAPSARGEMIAKRGGASGSRERSTSRAQRPASPRQRGAPCERAGRPSDRMPVASLLRLRRGRARVRPRRSARSGWRRTGSSFRARRRLPGMVAVRRHHVFVLEAHLGGNTWQVYDANSGGSDRPGSMPRSIAGYVIVNPRGRSA